MAFDSMYLNDAQKIGRQLIGFGRRTTIISSDVEIRKVLWRL